MNEETGRNMSKYYQGEKRLQERWRRDVDYFDGQSSSKQISSPDCLNEFNQEEKAKIFNDAYSCIGMFYRIVNDREG